MIFDIFKPGIVPHNRPNTNNETSILVTHAEIERPEYSYDWNSDGIRSIEFESKPNVVALGCSITLGQGLPVHLRWSDLLSKKIGKPIGNISYSGGSISQIVSSFMGMINQYEYAPEYVICNFAPFERFYFISEDGTSLKDYSLGQKPRKSKDQAPWDYWSTMPYEWVYYSALNSLQILEAFCKVNNIKLIWSTWTNSISKEQEEFLSNNFSFYYKDTVKKEFPPHFEFHVDPKDISGLTPYYKMKNWDQIKCHQEEHDAYQDIFDYAYDYHKIGSSKDKKITRTPHPGVHKHIHWSEFYHDIIKFMENNNE